MAIFTSSKSAKFQYDLPVVVSSQIVGAVGVDWVTSNQGGQITKTDLHNTGLSQLSLRRLFELRNYAPRHR
jgi:hypothetical protein